MRIKKFLGSKRNLVSDHGPIALLLILLSMTFAISYALFLKNRAEGVTEFTNINNQVITTISRSLTPYTETVQQTSILFLASEFVTREEFQQYFLGLKIQERLPGLVALGFASYAKVKKTEKDTKHYAPLKYIEPFSDQSSALLGMDIFPKEKNFKNQLKHALEKDVVITKKGHILDYDRANLSLYMPIINPKAPQEVSSERMESLHGLIIGLLDAEQVFKTIIDSEKSLFNNVHFSVFLVLDEEKQELVFTTDEEQIDEPRPRPQFKSTSKVRFGNKDFLVTVESLPTLEATLTSSIEYVTFTLGTLVSFLIFLIAKAFIRNSKSIEESESRLRYSIQAKTLIVNESKLLSQIRRPDELLNSLANFISNHISASCMIIYSESGGTINAILKNWPENNLEELKSAELNKILDLKEVVVQTKQYQLQEGLSAHSFYHAQPILVKGDVKGVLILKGPREISDPSLPKLDELTSIAGICLENTYLIKELEQSNSLKDEFLATVSHELRTPLNVIYGYAQLLVEEDLPNDLKNQITAILRSAKRQSKIIEDILDVSSLIKGKEKFEPRPLGLKCLLEHSVESIKLQANKKDLKIHFECPSKVYVLGVETKLIQVFLNILSNAIKFTPQGGEILISASAEKDSCIVTFRDTGRGINKDFLPHVFENFRQEDQTSVRSEGGLGLGLALVSNIMKLHKGSVKVESEGKGRGSTFTVTIPRVERKQINEEGLPINEDFKLESSPHILVVDDEPESINVIKQMLRDQDVKLGTATSAQEGLKKLKRQRFDILVSDIGMPHMSGFELIKIIRNKESETQHLPAIALTAYARETDAEKAISSGFDSFLVKPFDKLDFLKALEETLTKTKS
ncbi:MAG: hypothetical protein CME64_03230 [Halobacteriovoraceae bacterium]|nr:hypothetical protein [Halobacteriovoraceae bacterium]|tara:strand:+ start:80772 stop:83348 length:2577 start_codon:yes stop_codon:yes gene_type:complete